MQSIYAMHQSHSDNLESQEKFLNYSIDNIQDLYLIMVSSLIEIRKTEETFLEKSSQKHLATAAERNPNRKFVDNALLQMLTENNSLSIALENRKINNWYLNEDYIKILLAAIKQSDLYDAYMANDKNNFEEDKQFILEVFMNLIAPNEAHVERLIGFMREWDKGFPLVVHCWMGVSRSPAAALIAALAVSPEEDEFELTARLRTVAPHATPNARLVEIGDRILQRQGRLVAAVKGIGRGADTDGTVSFLLPLNLAEKTARTAEN